MIFIIEKNYAKIYCSSNLEVSHDLTLRIYHVTLSFPKEELFGLKSQMRRSSSTIPTNIAEGCGRNSKGDFKRFLTIASGSCSELEYQLILAKDLLYLNEINFQEISKIVIQLRKMIYSYSSKLDLN